MIPLYLIKIFYELHQFELKVYKKLYPIYSDKNLHHCTVIKICTFLFVRSGNKLVENFIQLI